MEVISEEMFTSLINERNGVLAKNDEQQSCFFFK